MGEQPGFYPRMMTCNECLDVKSFDSWLQLEQNPLCESCGEHAIEGNGYCWCEMCGWSPAQGQSGPEDSDA